MPATLLRPLVSLLFVTLGAWLASCHPPVPQLEGGPDGELKFDGGSSSDAGGPSTESDAGAAMPDGGALSWVRVAANGRYFVTDDGRPFIPIGHQPGTGFLELPDVEIDRHFAKMEEYGETVARIDFDHAFTHEKPPRYVGLESRVGQYDSAHSARLDTVFALAAKHNIRLLVVPYVTSPPMWESWSLNPYSSSMGGPAMDPYGFLVSPVARKAFGDRLEWISRRWGKTGTFFAWDLMNEASILLNWEQINDPTSLASWIGEIGARVRGAELSAHGRAHPRMVSWPVTVPAREYNALLDSPALDVASTHPYEIYGTQAGPNPVLSFVEPALSMHLRIRELLTERIPRGRPYLENERHMNDTTMLRFHRQADHDMAWAELASGAAGPGISWVNVLPIDDGWRHRDRGVERHDNLGPDRRAQREFVDRRVPQEFFLSMTTDEAFDPLVSRAPGVAALSVRRGRHAIGWLVGRDERCRLVDAINEVREERLRHERTPVTESALAVALWVKILTEEGAPFDRSKFEGLLEATQRKDLPAAFEEIERAFAYLEGLERSEPTLGPLVTCPALTPQLELAMPPGRYRVDWIDDTTAELVRSDIVTQGQDLLAPPPFRRHLAVVVRPE